MLGAYGWMTYGSPVINNNMSRSRNYCFTWNNYPEGAADTLMSLPGVKFLMGGYESAPETGTPHIQGFVVFDSPKTHSAAIASLPGCHVESCKGSPQANIDYCSKAGTTFSVGVPPMSQKEKGQANADRYIGAWENAKNGKIEDIPEDIRIRHYSALKLIQKDYMTRPPSLDSLDNEWHYGPTGSGKSRGVWTRFPDAYPKPLNNWWCGYQGQETVIIDDMAPFHVKMGDNLKNWADYRPFIADIKGDAKQIRPKRIIVTSNYHPSEIWPDLNTLEPLLRRFKVIHVPLVPFKLAPERPVLKRKRSETDDPIPCVLDGKPVLIDYDFNITEN